MLHHGGAKLVLPQVPSNLVTPLHVAAAKLSIIITKLEMLAHVCKAFNSKIYLFKKFVANTSYDVCKWSIDRHSTGNHSWNKPFLTHNHSASLNTSYNKLLVCTARPFLLCTVSKGFLEQYSRATILSHYSVNHLLKMLLLRSCRCCTWRCAECLAC